MKINVLLLAMLLFTNIGFAQTIPIFKYKGKTYFVYPFRINKGSEIPYLGGTLPDGSYIAFHDYTFKRNWFGLKKTNRMKLDDTTLVSAVFYVKNNLPNGEATIYTYDYKDRKSYLLNKTPYIIYTGSFVDGNKQGLWQTIDKQDGEIYLQNYNNNLLHGISKRFTIKNELVEICKYNYGNNCDTVFIYSKNKVVEEYDICEDSLLINNYEFDIYAFAFKKLNSYVSNKIKTYYKKYNENGDLCYHVKYKNNRVLPFDSIGYKEFYNGNTLKYVTVKKTNTKSFFNFYSKDHFDKVTMLNTYENQKLIEENTTTVHYKYGRKNNIKDSIINSKISTYYNKDKIDWRSIDPIVYITTKEKNETKKIIYFPKYKLLYPTNQNETFAYVDTSNKTVYYDAKKHSVLIGNVFHYTFNYKITSKQILKEKTEKYNPYLLKSYLLPEIQNGIPLNYTDLSSSERGVPYEAHVYNEENRTYYLKDTLMNGNYYFCNNKKKLENSLNINIIPNQELFNTNVLTTFINGKIDGTQKYLNYHSKWPKEKPLNLKEYFFSNMNKVNYYTEAEYKNGYLNGLSTKYYVYRNYNTKVTPFVYKQIEANYVNDTLNGKYMRYIPLIKKMLGNYAMGRPDGEFKTYRDTVELMNSVNFANGKLNGTSILYFVNTGKIGVIQQYANFKNNLLCDSLVYYHSNGKSLTAIYAQNDTLSAKKMFYFSGQLKEEFLFTKNCAFTLNKEIVSSDGLLQIIKKFIPNKESINGTYKNYYDNGQLLSEGSVLKGKPNGNWNYFSINGIKIHQVNFIDSIIVLPISTQTLEIVGTYKGLYITGNKRCDGYLSSINLDYDCFTNQDKAIVNFIPVNFYDINGKQSIKNGNGFFTNYDANGSIIEVGKLVHCQKDSLWKYYNADRKLEEIGSYNLDKKVGVWYSGDLQGVNFEDGACFDLTNPKELKAFTEAQKRLTIYKEVYENGKYVNRYIFNSNLSKTYRPRRRSCYTPSF